MVHFIRIRFLHFPRVQVFQMSAVLRDRRLHLIKCVCMLNVVEHFLVVRFMIEPTPPSYRWAPRKRRRTLEGPRINVKSMQFHQF